MTLCASPAAHLELFCIVGRWQGGREYQSWDTLWCLGAAMLLGVHAVPRYVETFKCHSGGGGPYIHP